jgi:hypothetical protein
MDIQTDISWIKSELDQVKDPLLIETFKNLLNYRRQHAAKDDVQSEMEGMILEGEDDIANGRVHSTDEVRREMASWRK